MQHWQPCHLLSYLLLFTDDHRADMGRCDSCPNGLLALVAVPIFDHVVIIILWSLLGQCAGVHAWKGEEKKTLRQWKII